MAQGRLSPYKQIELSLRTRVRDGCWANGESLPGRRKLAEEYGVALSTVQRAISSLIEDGTLEADGNLGTFVLRKSSDAAGYSPNIAGLYGGDAPSEEDPSSSQKALRVGILMHHESSSDEEESPRHHFFGPLFEGMRSVLARENVFVNYVYRERRCLEEIYRSCGCDGLITITPIANDLVDLKRLQDEQASFIAVLTSSDDVKLYKDLPFIDADNRQGAAGAVTHLLELGHTQIGIVNLCLSQTDFTDRFQGYLDALNAARLTVDPQHMLVSCYPWNEAAMREQTERWVDGMIRERRLPTAILACDLTMTLLTMAALQRHGVRIPEDISLVGFDDAPIADHTSPPLTLVRQPTYQIGVRAATRIVEHLRQSQGPLLGGEKLPTRLIVRRSTAAPPISPSS